MFKKTVTIGLMCSVFAVAAASVAQAQRIDNKTVLTFSQPVEIPGHVLPAGTYTFKLADSLTDRHIVQVFNADETKRRAVQLARAAKTVVPAVEIDVTDVNALKTAPIIAITADEKEAPLKAAIQTTPVDRTAGASGSVEMKTAARELPGTSSSLPTVVLFGFGALAAAFALFMFMKTAPATT